MIQFDPQTGEFSGEAARLTRFNDDGTTTIVYPTREAYAREVWASLDSATRADTVSRWHEINEFGPVVPFYGWLADNMDARHNGTVTFTRVDGGYTVQDDAAGEGE